MGTIPILAMVTFVVILSGLLFTFETAFACTVAKVRNNKFDDGGVVFRWVPNYPHTFYGDGPSDEINPTECSLQSYLDSIWLAFVTMTSVGYGFSAKDNFGENMLVGVGHIRCFLHGHAAYNCWVNILQSIQNNE